MTSAREGQALCCECGQLRTFKQARNHRGWWAHPDWHRNVGDLKCAHCGKVTTHALMRRANNGDEELQRIALGGADEAWPDERNRRLQQEYRQGNLPRNPYLHHSWFLSDAETARNAGESQVTAMCGEQVDLPPNPTVGSEDCSSDYAPPHEIPDMEYEDPDTGLWWVDMDCVDCRYVANTQRLRWQQRQLMDELVELAGHTRDLNAAEVAELREHLARLQMPATQ
jgi:hypothetical protein